MMTMITLLFLILVAIASTTLVVGRLGEEQANRRQDTMVVVNDIFAGDNNDQGQDMQQHELMIATNCTGTPWNCSDFGRGGIEYCYSSAGVNWTGCHWRWTSNTDNLDGHCYGIPNPCSDYHSDRVGCLMMGCTPVD